MHKSLRREGANKTTDIIFKSVTHLNSIYYEKTNHLHFRYDTGFGVMLS